MFLSGKSGIGAAAFATIAPREGASVPVAVWEISEKNEQALDHYEGHPSHYFKQTTPVRLEGKEVSAMVYIMDLRMDFGLPSPYYYQTVREGYNDCGLDTNVLDEAVMKSAEQFYSAYRQQEPQQTLFDWEDAEDLLSEPEDCGEYAPDENEQDMDENDPFYFPEEMRL